MSGREGNDEKEGEGSGSGGGWKTFWKVAGAAAATAVVAGPAAATVVVAGGLYSVLKQPVEAEQVAVEAGGSSGVQTKETTVWTKPKVGWFKLNVDGSLLRLREIPSAGCGGVLRDSSGNWIYGFAQKLSPCSREDETEKEGILKGLEWAKEKRFMRVEVESDNQGIVEKVKSSSRSTDPLILAIRELLRSSDWQTTLTWIPGSANRVADKLADIGRNLTSLDLQEYNYCPPSCDTAFSNDLRFL